MTEVDVNSEFQKFLKREKKENPSRLQKDYLQLLDDTYRQGMRQNVTPSALFIDAQMMAQCIQIIQVR